ncbi:retropepsin-like aspartic protease [Pedobacter lusitanus]|uniref:retropepsin-like aspartic protease n=1 Tax=Pedobacter lusitanus TaxID=1503925 RepID=UPI000AF37B1F|nr:aspartyl protease family protein [Pedobacter lusitanus]
MSYGSIILIVLSLYFPLSVQAQTFQFSGNRQKQTISFTLVKNLIIIPVYVNEKGPYNFLLDTGVAQMIITDTTFLADLDLKNAQTVKVQGYGLGDNIEAVLTRNITARVGKATINNIPTAIFKKDIFDLSSYLGIKIYGILGHYFFNSFIVKINYSGNRLTFYNPDTKIEPKGTKIPIQITNGKPYINTQIETATLGKIDVELLIDNGSSHPLMMESLQDKPFPLPPTVIPANLGVGINGIINGNMGRIADLKLGTYNFTDVLTGFPDFNIERSTLEGKSRNGSLGSDILRHFLVTFDYQSGFLYLKKTNNRIPVFEHDMSGLEVYVIQGMKDRFYIGRIESGSPGELAGLQANDEITAINFSSVQHFTLNDLTELLKEHDGKQILIEILRGYDKHIYILKLKKRI